MLYLISPPFVVKWTGDYIPREFREQIFGRADVNIGVFDWRPVEEPFGEPHLQIALRRGHINRAGILVDAGEFSRLRQIPQILESQARLNDANERLRGSQGDLMESLMPGWEEHGRKLDAEVNESTQKVLREARAEVEEVMAEEMKPELVAYWRAGGGVLVNGM